MTTKKNLEATAKRRVESISKMIEKISLAVRAKEAIIAREGATYSNTSELDDIRLALLEIKDRLWFEGEYEPSNTAGGARSVALVAAQRAKFLAAVDLVS